MKIMSNIPMGVFYKFLQKTFGSLNANPIPKIMQQIEIVNWLLNHNIQIKGKHFLKLEQDIA